MKIDLNTCRPGQKLRTVHGTILTYAGVNERLSPYRHVVYYPNGGYGTRTDDGQTFVNNKLPTDEDIVEILD